jgi:hypothetical protein|eukprot:COSAG01_NODE_5418_length_4274_cov_12.202150_7_plen_92_part_00
MWTCQKHGGTDIPIFLVTCRRPAGRGGRAGLYRLWREITVANGREGRDHEVVCVGVGREVERLAISVPRSPDEAVAAADECTRNPPAYRHL